MKKLIFGILICSLFGGLLAGCGSSDTPSEDSKAVEKSGTAPEGGQTKTQGGVQAPGIKEGS